MLLHNTNAWDLKPRHNHISLIFVPEHFSSLGLIGSFIIAFVAASSAVPRYLAFEIFAGTSKVIGGIGKGFVSGMHFAFIALAIMLLFAGIFSFARGKENRQKHPK